jgi:hypothetical protein
MGLMLAGCAVYDLGYHDYPYSYYDRDDGYTTVTLMSFASIMISANIMAGVNITTVGINSPIA